MDLMPATPQAGGGAAVGTAEAIYAVPVRFVGGVIVLRVAVGGPPRDSVPLEPPFTDQPRVSVAAVAWYLVLVGCTDDGLERLAALDKENAELKRRLANSAVALDVAQKPVTVEKLVTDPALVAEIEQVCCFESFLTQWTSIEYR